MQMRTVDEISTAARNYSGPVPAPIMGFVVEGLRVRSGNPEQQQAFASEVASLLPVACLELSRQKYAEYRYRDSTYTSVAATPRRSACPNTHGQIMPHTPDRGKVLQAPPLTLQ